MSSENKKASTKVRCRKASLYGGEYLQFLIEKDDLGVLPEEYFEVFRNMEEFLKVGAEMRDKLDLLEEELTVDGEPIQTYANFAKKKFVISGRVVVETRYFNKKDLLIVISSKGNDSISEEYYKRNADLVKKYVITKTVLFGCKFEPIYDDS